MSRGGGCAGDVYCVSSATTGSRDGNSGKWKVLRTVGAGGLREGDNIYLKSMYSDARPAYLNTNTAQRRRGVYYVSAASSARRANTMVGTWKVLVNSKTGPPAPPIDVVFDGTMVDAVHGVLGGAFEKDEIGRAHV